MRSSVLALLLLALSACGDPLIEPEVVASVTITPSTATVIIRDSLQLTAAAQGSSGDTLFDRTITWTSGDIRIVTVGRSGVVHGVARGRTFVIATTEARSDTAAVTVSDVPVKFVTIAPDTLLIAPNVDVRLTATTWDSTGSQLTGRSITWSTTAPTVARVDTGGLVHAQGVGEATITAVAEGQVGKAHVTVSLGLVPDVGGLWDWTGVRTGSLCADTGTFRLKQSGTGFVGNSAQTGTCYNGYYGTISVVRQDTIPIGLIAGAFISFRDSLCVYTAQVIGSPAERLSGTAICGGDSGAWEAVRERAVAAMKILPDSAAIVLRAGRTRPLSSELRDATSRRLFLRPVAWASGTPDIATVSPSGVVTGVNAGQATISAAAGAVADSIGVTITPIGALRVTAATSGADVDGNGYTVVVGDTGFFPIASNGSVTLAGLDAGANAVTLTDANANCDIADANPRAVTVPANDTGAVAFTVTCAAATPLAIVHNGDIHTLLSNGSGLKQLTYGGGRDPAWSPDGTKVAFSSYRTGRSEIYVVTADGATTVRLTNSGDSGAANWHPAWSPDGTRLAFVSTRSGNTDLYLMNADGTGVTWLTNDAAYDGDPAWSPDGQRIAFASNRSGTTRIWLMSADGANLQQLSPNTLTGQQGHPAWSPDGTKLAFGSGGYPYSVYVINADGSALRQLVTEYSGFTPDPAWSPNGSRIAYASGDCDYYYGCYPAVRVADVSGANRVTLWSGDGYDAPQPAWRP